eukprot:gene24776-10417_t
MQAIRAARQGVVSALRGNSRVESQQTRQMSGGGDDGVLRCNWWDAPTNPDIWQKHHLAWWTVAAYGGVYWLVAGGSKKEEPKTEEA